MSDTKKKTSLDEWDFTSAAPTLVRQPAPSKPRVTPTPLPMNRKLVANVWEPPRSGAHTPHFGKDADTIMASAPYAFQANAAAQLAELMDGAATVVTPESAPGHAEPAPAPAAHDAVPFKKPLVDVMKLNKLVVSSYKFMGFAILGTILLGLASFIATNLFYIFNESRRLETAWPRSVWSSRRGCPMRSASWRARGGSRRPSTRR
jgi:hypothetical protein